nr:putative ribonuclease H-like domain-containing protein [Tanacetum cinerariifolium]
MRTKPGLYTLSFDDLYNNLRVFERDVKGTTTSSSSNTQNVAFVSADNTSSTNDVSTAYSVSSPSVSKSQKEGSTSYTDEVIHYFFANQSSAPQLDCNDLEQINDDDLKKMDLKWQSGHVEEDTQNFAMMAYSSSNLGSNNENSVDELDAKTFENATCKSDTSIETTTSMPATVEDAPKVVSEPKDAPIIEEYESDSDDDSVSNVPEEHYDPHKALKDKGIIDSGCSRHMTGNKAHLADYQEFKGGSIAFRGSNGKITGKGKIKTGRFSWVYFLKSKDETTPILKDFIRQVENQFNHKVKTIRSDNGTKFKNHELIEFCGSKGIKREYSNAKTQQNGVAKRKNRTLIEPTRTMLADSLLPTTFWVEAVNIACYVINREELEKLKRKEKEANDALRKEATHDSPDANTNSTNLFNVVSAPVSVVGPFRALNDAEPSYPDDPSMPHLEDIFVSQSEWIFTNSSYDDEGVVTDFNNLETTVNTRSKMKKNSEAYALSTILYGTIDEEVYVTQPPGFVDPKFPNKVYKVVKALYGLHQAPKAWYATLSTFLERSGYRRGATDKTLFMKQDKKDIMLVQVYVDDIIFGSTKKS